MIQSRRMSLLESVASTTIGFLVALATQIVVFPWFGIEVSFAGNLGISAIFTIVSILRGYAVRRLFNWMASA